MLIGDVCLVQCFHHQMMQVVFSLLNRHTEGLQGKHDFIHHCSPAMARVSWLMAAITSLWLGDPLLMTLSILLMACVSEP